jgi:phosphate uptake regulator
MFKSLADFFRGVDWTGAVVDSFDEMLAIAERNFILCADHLVGTDDPAAVREEIYARDQDINSRERAIRRRIISHLAASPPEHEIPMALVLTSLVKDAERIGDYVKNLYETHQIHDFDRAVYDRYYDGIRTQMKALFREAREAFRESNPAKAHATITAGRETMKHCENAIREIASTEHSVPQAVALVLIGRHYKRICAHLVNIATSVVVPVDRLDYYDESLK